MSSALKNYVIFIDNKYFGLAFALESTVTWFLLQLDKFCNDYDK